MEIYRRSEKKNGVSRLVVFETSKCTRLFHPVFRWLPYLMTILNRSYPRSRGREGSMREDFSAPLVLDGFHRPGKISATKFVCTQVRPKPNRTETYPLVGGGGEGVAPTVFIGRSRHISPFQTWNDYMMRKSRSLDDARVSNRFVSLCGTRPVVDIRPANRLFTGTSPTHNGPKSGSRFWETKFRIGIEITILKYSNID